MGTLRSSLNGFEVSPSDVCSSAVAILYGVNAAEVRSSILGADSRKSLSQGMRRVVFVVAHGSQGGGRLQRS